MKPPRVASGGGGGGVKPRARSCRSADKMTWFGGNVKEKTTMVLRSDVRPPSTVPPSNDITLGSIPSGGRPTITRGCRPEDSFPSSNATASSVGMLVGFCS
jgi:hypothetical protein